MTQALMYERQIPAEKEFDNYDFSDLEKDGNSIEEKGIWQVAEDATHPDCTLMRTLKLKYNNKTYYRAFCVVFKPNSNEVEDVSFGDMLP